MPFKAIGRALGLGSQKTSQTATTTPIVPAEVEAARRNLLSRAEAFAAQPFQPYTAQRIAGFTPDELAALVHAASVVDGVVKGLRDPAWPHDPWQALERLMAQALACFKPAYANAR